jgi:hypothetical protein
MEKKIDTKGVPVKLLRAYCLEEGQKIPAGEVLKLSKNEAKRLVACGVAERADSMSEE